MKNHFFFSIIKHIRIPPKNIKIQKKLFLKTPTFYTKKIKPTKTNYNTILLTYLFVQSLLQEESLWSNG